MRLKPLVLTIFKQEREIGTFPNHALSDIRHCFDMLRRGRPVTISPDRVAEGVCVCMRSVYNRTLGFGSCLRFGALRARHIGRPVLTCMHAAC